MTNTQKLTGLALTGLVAAGLMAAHPVAAQVVAQTTSDTDGTQIAYGPYAASIINIGATTLVATIPADSTGLNFGTFVSGLHDDNLGLEGGLANTTGGTDGGSYQVTFYLNTAANATQGGVGTPLGYSITGINTSAGWSGSRVNQNYSVSYATVLAPTVFVPLAGATTNYNVDGNGFSGISHSTQVADSITGLDGVSALSFTFNTPTGGYATIFREVGVFGSPTIAAPEPSQTAALSLGVLGLAGLALTARKRRAA